MVDDVNMPTPDEWGTQGAIELLRQLVEYRGFYDRTTTHWRAVEDTTLLCAAAPTNGGRHAMSLRFTRHLSTLCLPAPTHRTLSHVMSAVLQGFLAPFPSDAKSVCSTIVSCTVDLFHRVCVEMLPTPSKFHYTFNQRDIIRVMQGLLSTTPLKCPSSEAITRLWAHEVMRVFQVTAACRCVVRFLACLPARQGGRSGGVRALPSKCVHGQRLDGVYPPPSPTRPLHPLLPAIRTAL
jgi:dynein heavy chain